MARVIKSCFRFENTGKAVSNFADFIQNFDLCSAWGSWRRGILLTWLKTLPDQQYYDRLKDISIPEEKNYCSLKLLADTLFQSNIPEHIVSQLVAIEAEEQRLAERPDINTGLIAASSFDEEFFSNIPLAEDVSLEMIKVKAGSFMMGSPEDEIGRNSNEILHKVTLTQDYWLGKFSVTEAQFKAVMYDPPYRSSPFLPIVYVDWHDANDFCARLNKKFKDKLPAGYQFALPTEAQWEYACRAGTTTAYCWGNSCNGTEANCDGNYPCGTGCKGPYLKRYCNVGSYDPNDWGFYDMHGNVAEWCRDWWIGDYDEGEVTDPVGPLAGSNRVIRGGSWNCSAQLCRSANRNGIDPEDRNSLVGFRLALVPIQ